jgi:hypothetical protein
MSDHTSPASNVFCSYRHDAILGNPTLIASTINSMTALYPTLEWLYEQPWATALRESEDVYPLIETVHVLSIAVIVGTVVPLDLRVLGLILNQEAVTRVARALLPTTWYGFLIMVLTGLPLFAAQAVDLYSNPAFRLKIMLLALAGSNALLFHSTTYRTVGDWDYANVAPRSARAFAVTSIVLWSAIIISGRLIAVFHAR